MFGQRERNRAESIIGRIVLAGRSVAEHFQYEESLQWDEAPRWLAFCGTIPAFAFAIVLECINGGSPVPSADQRLLFQTIEDILYGIYKDDSENHTVQIRQCLPLESEFSEVCAAFRTDGDTWVSMDMILGIILPRRLANYQKDWGSAFFRPKEVNLADYVAMRLAADLTGVPTPPSLIGHSVGTLGIGYCYGSALRALTEFAGSYLELENERNA